MRKIHLESFISKYILNTDDRNYSLMLDVYYNEIGRYLEGKLDKDKFFANNNQNIFYKFYSNVLYYRVWRRYANKKLPRKVDILIHINEKSHLREMIPIYNKLVKNYSVLFVTVNHNALKAIKEAEVQYLNLYYFFSIIDNEFFYSKKYEKNIILKGLKETFTHIENEAWGKDVITFLKNKRKKYYLQYNWYSHLFESFNIKYAFVANDLTSQGRLFTRIASSYNVETFSVQHGNIYDDWIGRHHIVDNFFVHGKSSAQLLKRIQHHNINILISGSPFLYEILINKNRIIEDSLLIRKKYDLDERYVLIAFSGHGHLTSREHYILCLESVNKLIRNNQSTNFIIKLHPKEQLSDYLLINNDAKNVKVIKEINDSLFWNKSIFAWLINAEALITGSSTIAIEAMLLSVPVISIDYANEYNKVEFRKKEASINVNTPDKLNRIFKQFNELGEDRKQKCSEFVTYYYGDINIDASEIVINNMEKAKCF
jgi:hypothetical protein